MIIITLTMGLIVGIFIGVLFCPSSTVDCSENDQGFFHPAEMTMEIDRLNNVIIQKDNQIGILNSAIEYLEEGGHVSLHIIECDYEENIIMVNVKNKLPNQLEIKSIGIIENYAYTTDWYVDYSQDATGLVPANGNLQLIWNYSKAHSLALEDNSNTLISVGYIFT
jgi:hypothetical protein